MENNPLILLFLNLWLRLLYSCICGLSDSLWMLPPCLCWNIPSSLARLCLCLGGLWSFQILLSFSIHGEKCRQINTLDGYLICHNF